MSDSAREGAPVRKRTEGGVEVMDVGQEAVRDAVLLVELDRALEDLVRERVPLREVLRGDCAQRAASVSALMKPPA